MLTTRQSIVEGMALFYNVSGNYLQDDELLTEVGRSFPMEDGDWFDLKNEIEDCFDVAPNIEVGRLRQCQTVGEIVKYVTSIVV